jgi:hypothetical protein
MIGLLFNTARTLNLAAPHEGLDPLPHGTRGEDVIGIAFLDPATERRRVVVAYVRKDLPGLDCSDPRAIRVTKRPRTRRVVHAGDALNPLSRASTCQRSRFGQAVCIWIGITSRFIL